MGFGWFQSPTLDLRASVSSLARSALWGVYLLNHHASPARRSSRFRLLPFTDTQATVRPYRSRSTGSTSTTLPKTISEVNFLARVPKSWPLSGQSIPYKRIFSAFPWCITRMVSPSAIPTHLPDQGKQGVTARKMNARTSQGDESFHDSLFQENAEF